MKKRNGFVSNSSSSSFMITNKTNKDLTIVDFVIENPQLLDEWNDQYGYNDTREDLLASAIDENLTLPANSEEYYDFGDEDGTTIGRIFDYILRDGGESKSFEWRFHEFHR